MDHLDIAYGFVRQFSKAQVMAIVGELAGTLAAASVDESDSAARGPAFDPCAVEKKHPSLCASPLVPSQPLAL